MFRDLNIIMMRLIINFLRMSFFGDSFPKDVEKRSQSFRPQRLPALPYSNVEIGQFEEWYEAWPASIRE